MYERGGHRDVKFYFNEHVASLSNFISIIMSLGGQQSAYLILHFKEFGFNAILQTNKSLLSLLTKIIFPER